MLHAVTITEYPKYYPCSSLSGFWAYKLRAEITKIRVCGLRYLKLKLLPYRLAHKSNINKIQPRLNSCRTGKSCPTREAWDCATFGLNY